MMVIKRYIHIVYTQTLHKYRLCGLKHDFSISVTGFLFLLKIHLDEFPIRMYKLHNEYYSKSNKYKELQIKNVKKI